MKDRSDLHDILVNVLGNDNVYYQPPASISMTYPCIVYKRDGGVTNFSDNIPYNHTRRYMVTVISKDPDLDVFDKMLNLETCRIERTFTSNGLHHAVYFINF